MANFMKMRLSSVFCLCFVLFLVSCSSSIQLLKDKIEQSSMEYKKGDVLKAYALLKSSSGSDELSQLPPSFRSRYEKLNADVTRALEYLIERWLSKAESLFEKGDLPGALRFYNDLLRNLPAQDEVRSIIDKEALTVRQKKAYVSSKNMELFELAQKDLSLGKVSEARDKLLLARKNAARWNLKLPLSHQRLLEECSRRSPAVEDKTENATDDNLEQTASAKPAKQKNAENSSLKDRLKHRRRVHKSRPISAKRDGMESLDRVERTYRLGLRLEKEGKGLKAIVALMQVLKLKPKHNGAKAALRRLDTVRKRSVQKWLKKASEFFAKEDLQGAAPYYRKVLQIDPGNLRAKEGLQMYLRLNQLKKKQK